MLDIDRFGLLLQNDAAQNGRCEQITYDIRCTVSKIAMY